MKRRVLAFVLVLVMLTFTGCGKVTETEEAIAAIGTVTMESGPEIEAAEALYNSLSSGRQGKVENADVLFSAREEYDWMTGLVQNAVDAIEAIGPVTLDRYDALMEAWDAFGAVEEAGLTSYLGAWEDKMYDADAQYCYLGTEWFYFAAKEAYDAGNYEEGYDLAMEAVEEWVETDYTDDCRNVAADCRVAQGQEKYDAKDYEQAVYMMQAADELYEGSSRPEPYTKLKENLEKALSKIRPTNGRVLKNKGVTGGYSRLVVISEDKDLLVKLVNTEDSNKYALLYVRAGETASFPILTGYYTLTYTAGDYWFGEDSKFGETGVYLRLDEVLDYSLAFSGNTVTYWERTRPLGSFEDKDVGTEYITEAQF